MKVKTAALNSNYVIDGIAMELTPAEILDNCLHQPQSMAAAADRLRQPAGEAGIIVDETTDPSPKLSETGYPGMDECLSAIEKISEEARTCPTCYSDYYTKSVMAKALLDCLWKEGNFKLCDLLLSAKWRWNTKPLGNMASFYRSVEAASEYIQGLGIEFKDYSFSESYTLCTVDFKVGTVSKEKVDEDEYDEMFDLSGNTPFGSEHPVIGTRKAVPGKLIADIDSWILYIPFDSCDFRLGNSLLSAALGKDNDILPEIGDADYFIDCFEVVREFIEDRIAISAASVAEGGLLTALKRMCSNSIGAEIDISGIMSSYDETEEARVLFSEVPGVLLQIKDADFDYIDAEFLLQDVAYYPIGHPVHNKGSVSVKALRGNKISDILQSLLNSQASEGED